MNVGKQEWNGMESKEKMKWKEKERKKWNGKERKRSCLVWKKKKESKRNELFGMKEKK